MTDDHIKVLDHGFVRLVGHYGDDAAIVQAARVSYGAGTKTKREDARLIDYLTRNAHTSPPEQVNFTFHMKLPIFVARQMVRHRTARLNEYSLRYSEAEDDFYVPDTLRIKGQGKSNKQGSDGDLGHNVRYLTGQEIVRSSRSAYESYKKMLEWGVARELARIVLPVNFYTTWYWQIDGNNLFKFLTLRLDTHAQWEIQEYARAVETIIAPLIPMAYESWVRTRKRWAKFVEWESKETE